MGREDEVVKWMLEFLEKRAFVGMEAGMGSWVFGMDERP